MLVTRFLGIALAASFAVPVLADEPRQTPAQNAQETQVQTDRTENQQQVGNQQRAATQQQAGTQLASTDLIGADIYGANEDDAIGSVNDIVLTKDGKVLYLIAGTGGLAGVGETEHAVPVEAVTFHLTRDGDDQELRVAMPMTEEDLQNAPELSAEHVGDLTVASFHERNNKYFKAANAQPVQKGSFLLVSELTDLEVTGSNNESIGELDLVILNQQGKETKASYFILGSGGVVGIGQEYTAVPFDKVNIQMTDDNEYQARINADERTVKAAPKLSADNNYAELQSEQTRQAIDKTFRDVR